MSFNGLMAALDKAKAEAKTVIMAAKAEVRAEVRAEMSALDNVKADAEAEDQIDSEFVLICDLGIAYYDGNGNLPTNSSFADFVSEVFKVMGILHLISLDDLLEKYTFLIKSKISNKEKGVV